MTVPKARGQAVICPQVCMAARTLMVFLALLIGTDSSRAKDAGAVAERGSEEAYLPDFFAEYAPQTALDMVLRLPGFVLEEEDDIRGFGAGAGNVLIDGTRPTTKSGGIKDALQRIPALQVMRIDLLRGTAGAVDAAGQSIVANVVRVKQSDARRWQLTVERAADGEVYPQAELTLSQHLGQWESTLKADAMWERSPREAETTAYTSEGELLWTQLEDRPSFLGEVFFSGEARRHYGPGELSINARLGWSKFKPETERAGYAGRRPVGSPDSVFRNERNSQYYAGELGIDWGVPLDSGWQWRLINLNNTQNWFVDADSQTEAPVSVFESGSQLRFDEHKTENILRTTLSKKNPVLTSGPLGILRREYGVELAYNNLESWLKLRPTDATGNPLANTRDSYAKVIEQRGEVFTNLTWKLYSLTVETGLAAEYSDISVSGDNKDAQSLFYLKPSLALIYNQNEQTQYRLTLRRSVGQLDFSDFAASADLVNDRQFSGNPQLRPDRNIRAGLAFDRRFASKGAFSVEVYQEWRKDVLEQIVLPSGDQALGNAGRARVRGVVLSGSLPLDPFIPKGLVEIKADIADSRFDDPVTGQTRELTELESPLAQVDFRQDFSEAGISWGLGYETYKESEEYFVNESNFFRTQGRWSAFIETVRFNDLKLRLAARNIGDERERWERLVYADNRNGRLIQREDTKRERGIFLSLTVNGRF